MNVFFSWQSDLNRTYNTNAIRDALLHIKMQLEDGNENFELNLTEATRNEAGTPNILEAIYNKICEADIFVADITIVNNEDNPKRPMPNPNVMIELGFAVATLGWERIILLYNTIYPGFPEKIPFDLDKHRISKYKYDQESDQILLDNLLKMCLQTIIDKNPKYGYNKKDPHIIQSERDLVQLQKFLKFFNSHLFDQFVKDLPDRISDKILVYIEYFNDLYQSASFKFYDKILYNHIEKFMEYYNNCLLYFDKYRPVQNRKYAVFDTKMDIFRSDEDSKAYEFIKKEKVEFAKALNNLVDYLRENYPEIDLEEVSKQAAKNYEKL